MSRFPAFGGYMSLTIITIKNLRPKAKIYGVADGEGLTLLVTPSGGKLWRYRYTFQGKPQMYALGKYPDISLAEARQLRDDAREKVKAGKHLTREKRADKMRQGFNGSNTFETVARIWQEVKSSGLNTKYSNQRLALLERLVFPHIGALPITEISIPDVVRVVEKIGKRGTVVTAKRVKQYISQIFRYAAQRGLCTHNPASDLRDILPSKERKHHACIHPDELPDLLKAIDKRKEDMSKMAMQLLALTFVRTGELIGAVWDEIDWERKEWRIPKERMKMKRPHLVPLSHKAIEVLLKLKKITGNRRYLFFSGASKSKHISNGTVLMALRRMNYQNLMTGHGFRTLASTILNENGYSPDVIEKQLAHEDRDKVRSAYNRAEYLPERKKMMQDYADILDTMKSKKIEQMAAE